MSELRASALTDYWHWLLRRYKRYRVTGRSMIPTLPPQTEILFDPRAFNSMAPQANDIVLARHPLENILIIKRVSDVLPDGAVVLKGDNKAESNDSRSFGPVKPIHILGKVISTFP